MRISDTKKRVGSVGVTAILLVGIGASFAYWTSGGVSTGEAQTGTTEDVVAVQTSTVEAMGPDVTPAALSGTFTNRGETTVRVAQLDATVSDVAKAADAAAGTCDPTDYALVGFPLTMNLDVAEGAAQGSWSGGAIQFKNKTVNQDACKNATVTITYTVS
jgi:hypothetical protein